jgi:hypothetical protein
MDSWQVVVLGDGGVGKTALTVVLATLEMFGQLMVWHSSVSIASLVWLTFVA